MIDQPKQELLTIVKTAVNKGEFIKMTLSKPGSGDQECKNIFLKPFLVKDTIKLSFTYRFPTKDQVSNFELEAAIEELDCIIGASFLNVNLFTTTNNWEIRYNRKRKSKIWKKPPTNSKTPDLDHDNKKQRLIVPENNVYLHQLGVTTAAGKVVQKKFDKFRQINKYIETIDHLLQEVDLKKGFKVADMGSGKGYLTFALYDYLKNNKLVDARITGIELRGELVDKCNQIAQDADFENLIFRTGRIEDYPTVPLDMLIALHACDTATDEAIAKGIKSNAKLIVCSPCCHKQIRQEMKGSVELNPMLKHGILLERQAEMVTDAIRALLLEANGYKTKVFEFVSTEHTGKNVMITALKSKNQRDKAEVLSEISSLKSIFGINTHHLETLI